MDLATPDYDVMYANEARAKEQALRDAGYTVDTGFDGQTVIRDSSGVTTTKKLNSIYDIRSSIRKSTTY